MFAMEKVYDELKSINNESNELRSFMIFYARMVLHDIHLLSEIKKEVKVSHQRNLIITTLDLSSIKLFGTATATLIAHESGKIKWASKSAHTIFEYSREEFQALNIKNLMPRYFAERHEDYVQKWKETGHHIKLNQVTYLWGSCKDGSCFSLLMFVKVVPLPNEQDYAFFVCLEKVEDQHVVICSSLGEIYGAGKLLPKVIGLSPKFLQEVRPNMQIFMPYTFEYFLDNFFPNNPKLKNSKKLEELRR